jgi:hypothetical protein
LVNYSVQIADVLSKIMAGKLLPRDKLELSQAQLKELKGDLEPFRAQMAPMVFRIAEEHPGEMQNAIKLAELLRLPENQRSRGRRSAAGEQGQQQLLVPAIETDKLFRDILREANNPLVLATLFTLTAEVHIQKKKKYNA